MKVTRFDDAKPYDAPNHFGVVGLRLQGFEDGGPTNQWVGYSQFLPGGDYSRLADLPSKDELLAKLVAMLNSPMQKLVSTISAPMQNTLVVLNNLKENKS